MSADAAGAPTDPFGLADLPDPLPIEPTAGPIDATVTLPGSKSITNRALVCAALAGGTSTLAGALLADDTEAMLGVLRDLGIAVQVAPDGSGNATITVTGCDGTLPSSAATFDVRQSGTTARFTLPVLSLGSGPYRVTAHPQMQARPMGETFDALRDLGAAVEEHATAGALPATIQGPARGGAVRVAGDASSQFLSGLLLSAPCRPDGLIVEVSTDLVSRPYVDLTISVMRAFGADVEAPDGRTFVVHPGGYRARSYEVEPDASAASYAFAAAALVGGRVRVEGLGSDALQGDAAFVEVLGRMGARVDRMARSTEVRVDPGATLAGGTFDFRHISDTAQTIAVVAPFADRAVSVTGIGFISRKEIDRVTAVATELARAGVGVRVDDGGDGWTIFPGPVAPTTFETYDDHRMAMSFALLGLRVPGVAIAQPTCVAKTFPGYWQLLEALRRSAGPR